MMTRINDVNGTFAAMDELRRRMERVFDDYEGRGNQGPARGFFDAFDFGTPRTVATWPRLAVYDTGSALVLYAAPALMSLLQLALSHARESEADAGAALLTGDALGLAGAIRRLPDSQGSMLEDLTPPAFARRVPAPSLLRSHPAPEARIERLLPAAAAAEPGTADRMPPLAVAEEPLLLHVGFGPAQMRPRYRWPGVWW